MLISDGSSDVCSSVLLRVLQAPRVNLDQPRQCRDPYDAGGRQIGDMCISDDGREMVLAVTYESNAGKHDGFVVAARLAEAPRKQGDRLLAIAPAQFLVGADEPRGRNAPTLPVRLGTGDRTRAGKGRGG